jgi:hypothetical protein
VGSASARRRGVGGDESPTRSGADDGKALVAPNGVPVVRGFRDYIMARTWAADDWPLAAEQVIVSGSIEPGNAAIGPGSRQDFRLTSLGWTQAKNVYVIYVGQDIRALEQQLAAANAHVAQLEVQIASTDPPGQTPQRHKNAHPLCGRMSVLFLAVSRCAASLCSPLGLSMVSSHVHVESY